MINFNFFKSFKNSSNKIQVLEKNDLKNVDINKIFYDQGFFIIKNFFNKDYIKKLKKFTDETLELSDNIMQDRVLTDACNHHSIFNEVILNTDLDFINKKILGDNYIFLQTFDLHANQNAHQWHRDISSKKGNVVNYKNEKSRLIKYAIYLEVKNSIFAVIPESNQSNNRGDLFGKDIYFNQEINFNTKINENYDKNKILFIQPEPGDLVAFDFRLLHCACNVDQDMKPSDNKNQLEKKVIWPAFGGEGNLSEAIYQYFRFVRRDFGEQNFDRPTEILFAKKNILPKSYNKKNDEYIKWIEENIMLQEQFKPLMFLAETDQKVVDFRNDYYKRNKDNPRYKLLAEKNKVIADHITTIK
tara:strand:- start:1718 stop:2791 length:1074 start_codon:yes stop_codon:yes gene_type:complete